MSDDGTPPLILNVNDSQAARASVRHVLERGGYRVIDAEDGQHARLLVAQSKPDLVVLDVRLSDSSGLEICRALKQNPDTASIAVLHTSATHVSREERVAGLESGADGYLVQPFEGPELLATVRALLRVRRAERDARRAGQQWSSTIEALADGIALLDPDGRVVRVNRAMAQLLERPVEIVGHHYSTFGGSLARAGIVIESVRRTVAPRSEDAVVNDRWFRVAVSPVLEGRDVLAGHVVVFSDINDRKLLEEAQRRRAEMLADVDRRKDEFLAMLAHELRNPLSAIATAMHLHWQGRGTDPALEQLRTVVERQMKHMSRLVDDLLDVSRITRGRIELRKQPLDLARALEAALVSARSFLDGRRQTVKVVAQEGRELLLDADPVRMEQIIVNLLSNASKYSGVGSKITIVLGAEGQGTRREAVLRVRDEGVGIATEMLDSIFDLFVQVDQSLARSRGGLGIGLTMVRSLVAMHGGVVRAGSEGVGKGAEIEVRLPLPQSVAKTAASVSAAPVSPGPDGSLRTLIIEDNPDTLAMMQLLVTSWGHTAIGASDGLSGLDLALSDRPDVALVDVGLPGISGYQVAANLRASAAGGDIYLVAVTGYGRPEDRSRALDAGFDAYIIKPVNPAELERLLASRELRAALARRRKEGAA